MIKTIKLFEANLDINIYERVLETVLNMSVKIRVNKGNIIKLDNPKIKSNSALKDTLQDIKNSSFWCLLLNI